MSPCVLSHLPRNSENSDSGPCDAERGRVQGVPCRRPSLAYSRAIKCFRQWPLACYGHTLPQKRRRWFSQRDGSGRRKRASESERSSIHKPCCHSNAIPQRWRPRAFGFGGECRRARGCSCAKRGTTHSSFIRPFDAHALVCALLPLSNELPMCVHNP